MNNDKILESLDKIVEREQPDENRPWISTYVLSNRLVVYILARTFLLVMFDILRAIKDIKKE